MDLDQAPWIRYIQLHRFIPSQREHLVKIHLAAARRAVILRVIDSAFRCDVLRNTKKLTTAQHYEQNVTIMQRKIREHLLLGDLTRKQTT